MPESSQDAPELVAEQKGSHGRMPVFTKLSKAMNH